MLPKARVYLALVVAVETLIWMCPSFCLMKINRLIDVVYFGQLRSKDGSIVHSGDNLTGAGDG